MSDIKIVDSGIQIAEESDIKFANEPRPKTASPWNWLRKFSSKAPRKDLPGISIDKPTEVLNEPDISQESEVPVQSEIKERTLRPANKIFFHTGPSENIGDILQTGLIATEKHDVIGRDLDYSLTFPEEFNLSGGGRQVINLNNSVSDFSLTIWRASSDIKKLKKEDKRGISGFKLAKKLESTEAIPPRYLESRGGGSWDRTANPEKMRKADPANFLAAIPIDQSLQEELIRCKMEFAYNLADADTIEESLTEFLNQPDRNLQLSQDYTVQALAHDLMANIQQEVSVKLTGQVTENSSERNPSLKEMEEVSVKTLNVNEPVSFRYLRSWEQRIRQAYGKKGIVLPTAAHSGPNRGQSIVSPYELCHYDFKLVKQVASSMGITL